MSQFFKTLLAAGCALALGVAALFAEKTNVIVFLVDDMGYSDPGYMGGEAETPHLNGRHRFCISALDEMRTGSFFQAHETVRSV